MGLNDQVDLIITQGASLKEQLMTSFQNRYQECNHLYINICTYSFDLQGLFKVKVNQVLEENSYLGGGIDFSRKVLLAPQVKQTELMQKLNELHAQTWHIITAFDPRGSARFAGDSDQALAENHRLNLIAHAELVDTAQKRGYRYQECNCGTLDHQGNTIQHVEQGLVFFDISEAQALEIAKQFDQNAWVGGDLKGHVCLYWEPSAKRDMLQLPPRE